MYDKVGRTFCRMLLKASVSSDNVLSDKVLCCDWLTLIAAKREALKANHVRYMQGFAEDSTNPSKCGNIGQG